MGGKEQDGGGAMRLSQPLSDTLSHSASQRETVDGWENTRREVLTRRLSYHGIRSGLWETAPPKHTRTLSHTHADAPAAHLHTMSRQGRPEGRWRKAAGHTPVPNKCLPIPLSFLARASEWRLQTSPGLGHTVNRQTGMGFFGGGGVSQNVGGHQEEHSSRR